MADSEKEYLLRKQIKKLAAYKGSGTELISVYIPTGSAVHEMGNKLREEMSQASNIKSKSTKTNVIGALERIINHLKLFKKTPPNGLAAFCGNISDNPAKVEFELISMEPAQPLKVGIYRCDSRFFLEPLENMLESKDAYGVLVMDGRDATLAIVKGTSVNIVKKLHSTAHQKVTKGGQCLAEGTLVMKSDGNIIEIQNSKHNQEFIGLDFNTSKTLPVFASDYFVTPAKHSFILKTQNPLCEIRATSYHRFFVLSEYGVKEKFAKDLDSKDKILIAKKINCSSARVKTGFVPNSRIVLSSNERDKLKRTRIDLGLLQKEVAKKIGVSQTIISDMEIGEQTPTDENLEKIYKLYGVHLDKKRLSKKILNFPEYWNENLARLCGIICGDGTHDGNRIIIYEGSKEIVENYCLLIEKTIGVKPTVRNIDKIGKKGSFAKKVYYEIRIYSKEFVRAIEQIAPEVVSKERDIPNDILKCNNSIIAAFLSGIYDAEGYMRARCVVDIAMTDKKLLKKIQLLLLRFGILSSFSQKNVKGNNQWIVSICDKHSIKSFRDDIGFSCNDKKKKLKSAVKRKTTQQYIDQIPIDGREVYKLAKEIGLKTSDFHAASYFFRNKKQLGREAFARNILSIFSKHTKTKKEKEIYNKLQTTYSSDFTVASIKEKILVKNKEKFYDLTIPNHSNFIANGFIVHNSQRRYQRLVEEQIEKYYQRIGTAFDEFFLGKVKSIMVGGPGPAKDNFLKLKPFNYQLKVLGPVDTGYTDDYGVREVMEKSSDLLSEQDAIKEKKMIDRFIKEVINDGLATYGVKQVVESIKSKQASMLLLSEGLEYNIGKFTCNSCNSNDVKITKDKLEEKIDCASCEKKQSMRLTEDMPLIDELTEMARENNIKTEIISTNTVEGAQFLNGFAGIGAFLRYKSR